MNSRSWELNTDKARKSDSTFVHETLVSSRRVVIVSEGSIRRELRVVFAMPLKLALLVK